MDSIVVFDDYKRCFRELDSSNYNDDLVIGTVFFKRDIVDKYNSIYKLQMPEITPHVCRHTYCSNMAKSGMNPKTLQYLMGHADIGTTLNVYTHVNFEDAKAEIEKLNVV